MNVTSSDPGASGTLTPFAKIEDLNFNNSSEIQDSLFEFELALREHIKQLDTSKVLAFDSLGGATTYDEYIKRREKAYSLK